MSDHQETLAVIDIGTNSVRLIIAESGESDGPLKIIDAEREAMRLGSGSFGMKSIPEDAIGRTIEILGRFKAIAEGRNASIHAVATSTVREAANQAEFLKRVSDRLGLKVHVISGFEEARLIYLGILRALPVFGRCVFLIDVGGGSTEFLIGKEGRVMFDNSLKLGSMRLHEQFFRDGPASRESVHECARFIAGMLSTVKRQVSDIRYDVVVGTSGTILNLASMISARRGSADARLNNFSFTRRELLEVVGEILAAPDGKARERLPGLDPKRADIIVPGALILREVMAQFAVEEMTVSEYSLKEGVIAYVLNQRSSRGSVSASGDIRGQSVEGLARAFAYELPHSRHVSFLARRIFDQTAGLHGLEAAEREILGYAALLHDIGIFISRSQHHRHSYYIIRNSELIGFTENEKEMIANIARYHRKSHPKTSHEGFMNLDGDGRKAVTALAAILRVADGLDRGHAVSVKDIRCEKRDGALVCTLLPNAGKALDLEIWGAERKKQLLEETFGLPVRFES